MKKIFTIAKKEWQNYFSSPIGYIFAALLLLVTNWLYFSDIFLLGQADISPFLSTMTFLFSLFIPAISMGLLAEEKKNSTWEVLLSMPITETQLVLGKMIGCGLYLLFTILLSLPAVVTVLVLGSPEIGVMVTGFIGLILLGMAYLSTGLFMSGLSSQPIVGFLGSAVFLIVNNLMGQGVFLNRLPEFFRGVAENISLSSRMISFGNGLLRLNDLLFFLSWITVFLILSILTLRVRDK
jgi:ABC-2 type transport system permease protein